MGFHLQDFVESSALADVQPRIGQALVDDLLGIKYVDSLQLDINVVLCRKNEKPPVNPTDGGRVSWQLTESNGVETAEIVVELDPKVVLPVSFVDLRRRGEPPRDYTVPTRCESKQITVIVKSSTSYDKKNASVMRGF